jgi:3-phosphoinositide dependent protein kinase-1
MLSESEAKEAGEEGTSKKNSFVGTAEYCSPELLNDRAASYSSDIWAIGCILYQLIAGKPPFKGSNEYQTFQKIIKLEYSIPDDFPAPARNIVEQILNLTPESRPTIPQIKSCQLYDGTNWDGIENRIPPQLEPINPNGDDSVDDLSSTVEELILMGSSEIMENSAIADKPYPFLDPDQPVSSPTPPPAVVDVPPTLASEVEISSQPGVANNKPEYAMPAIIQTQSIREQQLIAQRSTKLGALVLSNELILLAGSVYKRKVCRNEQRLSTSQ